MAKRNPIIPGTRFDRMVVLSEIRLRGQPLRALCLCDCGTQKTVVVEHLRSGDTGSCGCKKVDSNKTVPLIHGAARRSTTNATYIAWLNMKARCYSKNRPDYHRYGGRGIAVCDRWRNSFANFFADMGERPSGMTLDRINNNGNYEPGNCQWATRGHQTENREKTRKLTFMGETRTIKEWSKKLGLNRHALRARINRGWSAEAALSKPTGRPPHPSD